MIRCAGITSDSVVDGNGLRVVAFLQGCPHRCEGCHNVDLQPLEGGRDFTETELAQILLSKVTPLHKGITFSGGEPLIQAETLHKVISIIKEKKPHLDIWVYSGYTFEQVRELPVMELIDVLVDGPFVLERLDLALPFRGSDNQRIIDVPRSLQEGQVVRLQ
ncbi:MAG: anaerobic ribonucleoside-triphosphate reductase activating protein [Syntrophomonadaceae bacterium]|jgi:anaerobic ribonucleoside-triphosphate reductase activating protein|nr:anaerobic ribonucleoside-triphosphate reductase activating protein [Syntrophomonadaceae bacterium]